MKWFDLVAMTHLKSRIIWFLIKSLLNSDPKWKKIKQVINKKNNEFHSNNGQD